MRHEAAQRWTRTRWHIPDAWIGIRVREEREAKDHYSVVDRVRKQYDVRVRHIYFVDARAIDVLRVQDDCADEDVSRQFICDMAELS